MSIKRWLVVWSKAARAPFLVVSFIPACIGGAIAAYHGYFDWTLFIVATIGVVMAHSAADFVDDYFDFKNGNLGNKEKQFHDSPLINGEVTLRQVFVATALCFIIAVIAGVYVVARVGMPVVYIALAGTFIVYFYTAPPVRLNYRGLGETMLFFAFGPLIVMGVYVALTGQFHLEPLLVSLVPGIFTMNVGLVSNTFDYLDDVESGKKCFPVRFGQPAAVKFMIIMTVAAYAITVIAALLGYINIGNLAVLVTIPMAWGAVSRTRNFHDPAGNYSIAMTKAIGLSTLAGLIMLVAYLAPLFMGSCPFRH
ncbi:MAG: prenyltransferase [Chloroflexota bacterium]